jgi:hypothetical protein
MNDNEELVLEQEQEQEQTAQIQQPKKRGRKPKITEEVSNVINKVDSNTTKNEENDSEDGALKTKRRGRKPKDKFKYENTEYDDFQKNSKKEENIIIKLPLSCLKLNEEFNVGKDLFPYNPNITTPKPYNPEQFGIGIGYSLLNEDDNLSEENDKEINKNNINFTNNNINVNDNANNNGNKNIKSNSNTCSNNVGELTNNGTSNQFCDKCIHCKQLKIPNCEAGEARQIDIILNNKYNSNTDKFNLMTHMGISINGNKWIEKTDIACLWCCHQFKNTPWGIPYKFVGGIFQLFGNFCLPNCALSYILKFYNDDDSLWEKVALLNLLYFKVYGQYKTLIPSYDKMSLKIFGGTLEIEEYRNLVSNNDKSYNIEFPPCNTIIPMLEEIYKKTQLNNTFIPIDKNRINIANNELKLKRSKPIINHKNTLDFCLSSK